jgi:hypothetical protein
MITTSEDEENTSHLYGLAEKVISKEVTFEEWEDGFRVDLGELDFGADDETD